MKKREAAALGLARYFTGKACKHGHLSERYTSTGQCAQCTAEQSQIRRIEHPEKAHAAWRKWLENNRELHGTRVRRWQAANPEKVKEAAKAWVAANSEKVAAKSKRYRQTHPDQATAMAAASVAKRSKRVPKWLTADDKWLLREAYSLAKLRTEMFGFVWEVDHILPLRGETVSGLHVPTNVQVIPKALNRRKRNVYHPN